MNASSIISSSVYFISGGSSDFLQNYYLDPVLYKVYSPDEFSDMLIESFIEFVHEIYELGARKIGVTTLPPLGCLPAAITLFGDDSNECVPKLNRASVYFNDRLNATTIHLQKQLTNLTLVVLDIYKPLYDLVMKPEDFGFVEARKACCGTGVVELSILCNSKSVGTCANATQYVFWDGVHPSEAANKLLSDDLLAAGISLVS
jgi:phospholipase/lecithinase/hemolysin